MVRRLDRQGPPVIVLVDLGALGLDQADGLLAQMIAANYRSPSSSLRDLF